MSTEKISSKGIYAQMRENAQRNIEPNPYLPLTIESFTRLIRDLDDMEKKKREVDKKNNIYRMGPFEVSYDLMWGKK